MFRFSFFLFCEPSRQWLSVQCPEGEKEYEDFVQSSHSITLSNLGSNSAGQTDREERNTNHDPGVIIKGSDNVRSWRKFPGRFRNPVHGVHTNTMGIIHQCLSLRSIADDGDTQVCFSIANLTSNVERILKIYFILVL